MNWELIDNWKLTGFYDAPEPCDWSTRLAVVGLFIALSSTAVVLKELARRNQLHSPHGRLTIGVLLLQDLVVIAVLATAPTLLGSSGATGGSAAGALVRLVAVGAGVLVLGRVVLPRLLRTAAALSREAFSLSVLLASVGTAVLAAVGGLSMAAGAFLAGLILAEGEFSHQVHADVRPLRDLLASLFFVSVGMLIDMRQMLPILPMVMLAAVGIMLAKTGVAWGALAVTGAPLRVALAGALALSQVGEFSFVLGRAALDGGVISRAVVAGAARGERDHHGADADAGRAGARACGAARRPIGRPPASLEDQRETLRDHVVILGYGMGGQLVAQSLTELVGSARRAGVERRDRAHGARAGRQHPLRGRVGAGAARGGRCRARGRGRGRAQRSRRFGTRRSRACARSRLTCRSSRAAAIGSKPSGCAGAGATLAVAEELEASLEVLSQLLARLHIPGNVVEALVDNYRRVAGAASGRSGRAPSVPLDQMPREIVDAPVSSFRLMEGAWAVGRTLQELDLRNSTGATVLAVRRAAGRPPRRRHPSNSRRWMTSFSWVTTATCCSLEPCSRRALAREMPEVPEADSARCGPRCRVPYLRIRHSHIEAPYAPLIPRDRVKSARSRVRCRGDAWPLLPEARRRPMSLSRRRLFQRFGSAPVAR